MKMGAKKIGKNKWKKIHKFTTEDYIYLLFFSMMLFFTVFELVKNRGAF